MTIQWITRKDQEKQVAALNKIMDSIKPLGDWSDKHTLDLKFASRAA